MEPKEFRLFLNEKMRERGLTPKKLAEASGIPPKHLQSLVEGDFERLPPAPYVRGYLFNLGSILEFDPQPWWEHFQKEELISGPGRRDALPKNRFAPRSLKKYAWTISLALLVLLYVGIRLESIFGKPRVLIHSPNASITVTNESRLVLAGTIENGDELFVNGELTAIDEGGNWQKVFLLEPGLNTVEIKAKKFLGRELRLIRQIVYESATSTAPAPSPL